MDRREAIEILRKRRTCALYDNDAEALDLAIEVLQEPKSEQYKKGFEDAKRAFLIEYARESESMRRRNAQLEVMLNVQKAISAETTNEGKTSTISEKHQLMLPLDDAVKVVGRICDEWWTLEDGDIEFIRNELEQKCYRIDQTTCNQTCNKKQVTSKLEPAEFATSEGEESTMGQPTERTGEWIKSEIPNELYVCSECGGACWSYDYERNIVKSNYCPNCGAKMKGGTENE